MNIYCVTPDNCCHVNNDFPIFIKRVDKRHSIVQLDDNPIFVKRVNKRHSIVQLDDIPPSYDYENGVESSCCSSIMSPAMIQSNLEVSSILNEKNVVEVEKSPICADDIETEYYQRRNHPSLTPTESK
ncbi:hypothetical protein QTN25_001961 [Entamoeba marina]